MIINILMKQTKKKKSKEISFTNQTKSKIIETTEKNRLLSIFSPN